MANISHSVVALNNTTPALIDSYTSSTNSVTGEAVLSWTRQTVSIQNVDTVAIVYVGAAGVSSSSYGHSLAPGASVTLDDLTPGMNLYAISSATSSNVAVLQVSR